MNKLDCGIIKDLLPSYSESLVSEETQLMVSEHLNECKDCMDIYLRMNQDIKIEQKAALPSKKLLFYLNRVRIWYLVCPLIALTLFSAELTVLWHFYEGALLLMCCIFISSQFLCGLTPRGFDMEQVKYQIEAEKASKLKWGIYRVSPINWCIPALLVIVTGEIPNLIKFIRFLMTYFQS